MTIQYLSFSGTSVPGISPGDLAGVMWYLHKEVIASVPRKYNVTRTSVTVKPWQNYWKEIGLPKNSDDMIWPMVHSWLNYIDGFSVDDKIKTLLDHWWWREHCFEFTSAETLWNIKFAHRIHDGAITEIRLKFRVGCRRNVWIPCHHGELCLETVQPKKNFAATWSGL